MSIGDCPNWPKCGHRSEAQCDADSDGRRGAVSEAEIVVTTTLNELLADAEKQLKEAKRWFERNTREGHLHAAQSWMPEIDKARRHVNVLTQLIAERKAR